MLALTSGANRVDVGAAGDARRRLRSDRRATPEEAREATGFAVGGTPPFGHPEPVRTFLDRDLLAFEEVWAAAGNPGRGLPDHPDRAPAHAPAPRWPT